ncbi:MAG TPA: double zinc ribbon domain-containing protein [Chryseobacterium sp.]
MILDIFFPNRCIHCNKIIDGSSLVCNLCFEQIHLPISIFLRTITLRKNANYFFLLRTLFLLCSLKKRV